MLGILMGLQQSQRKYMVETARCWNTLQQQPAPIDHYRRKPGKTISNQCGTSHARSIITMTEDAALDLAVNFLTSA